ncbi:hypothetical protein [Falsirhodobacter halotolerans]|uniref:hypothetical protein n=1 Tax=Falsirhodobacter halotolerans TaxID=1146892 RepID=UPI001FD5BF71|nr:hypothetical protein [Falsirhodobacter halotolerans]MCJ8141240.1 hypothetical protein [Falsirhodobacter halotolerans]
MARSFGQGGNSMAWGPDTDHAPALHIRVPPVGMGWKNSFPRAATRPKLAAQM